MNLYEILTGWVGESYERAYAWAKDLDQAKALFTARHPDRDVNGTNVDFRLVMSSDAEPFCTSLDDSGWPDDDCRVSPPPRAGRS